MLREIATINRGVMYRTLLIALLIIFSFSFKVAARKKSNVFNSSVSDVVLNVKGMSKPQIITSIHGILKGREKWLDSFLEQNPGKLEGVFVFEKKINILGVAYSTSPSSARAEADKLCLKAMAENDIEQVGVYSRYLKVSTKNGYFIYAILRSPVSSGFRSMDFSTGSNEVDELFK